MRSTVKVLIIDDSELIRSLLTEILSQDPNIDVVGSAIDPFDAREKIKELKPDVLTLDIEMPRMDGITFLKNIMRLKPMPVVMISTLTEKGADVTLQALQLGAIDYISKPKLDVRSTLPALAADIVNKVKHAARANISAVEHNIKQEQLSKPHAPLPSKDLNKRIDVICIGASTGGTEAIKEVLMTLPEKMPPILIAQHMPGGFTQSFAKRLNSLCKLNVKEFSSEREPLVANTIYVANGDYHMTLLKRSGDYYLIRDDSDPVNRHKPSVDVLFNSVVNNAESRAIGVILTGMGMDGAQGLKNMLDAGAYTLAQDEASSVVWGMPRVAVEKNAARETLPLRKIGEKLINLSYKSK